MVLATEAAVVPIGIQFSQGPGRGWRAFLGTMTMRIGRPLHFTVERAMAREIAADPNLSPRERQRWSTRLAAQITHHLMDNLAGLSGKRYPFPAPQAQPHRLEGWTHDFKEALCPGSKPARL
jgi:hypothetical protein